MEEFSATRRVGGRIQFYANEALEWAQKHKDEFDSDAINWADLRCVDVERVTSLNGSEFWRVVIEECSPTSSQLREHVQEYLRVRGFTNLEVVTEW